MNRRLIGLLICLAILGMLTIGQRVTRSKRPALKVGPFVRFGQVVAQRATELTGGTGNIVLWSPTFKSPAQRMASAVDGFRQAMKQAGSLAIVADEHDAVARDGLSGEMDMCALSPERLLDLLQKHHNASLVVIFGGLPQVNDALLARLPN